MPASGRPFKQIGLEFEGGWDSEPWTRHDYLHTAHDGSVRVSGDYHRGEVVTDPLDTLEEALGACDDGYPDRVDDSCGFHVHMSFQVGDYHRLMDATFWDHFRAFWVKVIGASRAGVTPMQCGLTPATAPGDIPPTWTSTDVRRFAHRFNGGNSYCEAVFRPLQQMYNASKGSARYAQLNYCHRLHKTVECRLLPQFETREGAKSALKLLVKCFSDYLEQPDTFAPVLQSTPAVTLSAPDVTEVLKEIHVVTTAVPTVIHKDIVSDQIIHDIVKECNAHPDIMRRAPKGSFKMLQTGDARKVRARVEAFLRKCSEEGDE